MWGAQGPKPPYLWCVVPQPVISFSEIIEDDPAAIPTAGRENDGGGGIGLTGHPGGVEGVGDQEERHDQDHAAGNLQE